VVLEAEAAALGSSASQPGVLEIGKRYLVEYEVVKFSIAGE